jgi:hypothetical protein
MRQHTSKAGEALELSIEAGRPDRPWLAYRPGDETGRQRAGATSPGLSALAWPWLDGRSDVQPSLA